MDLPCSGRVVTVTMTSEESVSLSVILGRRIEGEGGRKRGIEES